MSFINLREKIVQVKIVYYGPGRGGKTTNLEYINRKFSRQIQSEMISLKTHGDRADQTGNCCARTRSDHRERGEAEDRGERGDRREAQRAVTEVEDLEDTVEHDRDDEQQCADETDDQKDAALDERTVEQTADPVHDCNLGHRRTSSFRSRCIPLV